ncbi:hypothetical protein GCM10027355_03570 [Haloplanus salinarum]
MYLVIVGAGDIGIFLLEIATTGVNEVAAIERDEGRADRAARQYDCLVINDDATTKETLQVLVVGVMVLGSAAGSTVGGIKIAVATPSTTAPSGSSRGCSSRETPS